MKLFFKHSDMYELLFRSYNLQGGSLTGLVSPYPSRNIIAMFPS